MLFISGTASLAVSANPAAGLLFPELFQWYCSAALPKYLPFHPQVRKNNF
jgi:hypothetical protein